MLDQMSLTQVLALLLGLYFVAASIGMLIDPRSIDQMLPNLADNPMMAYLAGIMVFVIGGTIISVHNIWIDVLSSFVTFVGWAALIEGLLLLIFRERFVAFFANLNISQRVISIFAFGTLVVGVGILYLALTTS